ncbi:hypothetical protein HMN09_00892800 [Mycena chlorophos]|uniref:PNK3P-domain-containing protein n=1 Tax=Mycena chlorophos TaxID=658473 RepID=A0A8H6W5K1_MYCCL|nr:hypothetical protein HMN09_00892800 [Mycena chlorophos]
MRALQWLDPVARTCMHAEHLVPRSSRKVAAFALENTLITTTETPDWWDACVPGKLAGLVQDGYAIVVFTNELRLSQFGPSENLSSERGWKEKLERALVSMPNVPPFRMFVATGKTDRYRKPMTGMWQELERLFADDGVNIDKSASFYVGHGAGRQNPAGKRNRDSTGIDRKFALNLDIPFFTPEVLHLKCIRARFIHAKSQEYFLGHPTDTNVQLEGFHVSQVPLHLPRHEPTSSPLLPPQPTQELVLLVGLPCIGKTTLYRTYFAPAGYQHINIPSRDKSVQELDKALKAGERCVVAAEQNAMHEPKVRQLYLDLARTHGVPVRCMLFTGSRELAYHNNCYRAFCAPKSVRDREGKISRELLPRTSFNELRLRDMPQLSEGFSEIRKVHWVFEGTVEERKVWAQWMLQLQETVE